LRDLSPIVNHDQTSVRWKIGILLCAVALVNFFQRVNISVSGDAMMRELGITQTDMGAVFSAFVLGYTLFQIPGGMLADRFGPRAVLALAALLWAVFTALTGMIGALRGLIAVRFLFGLSQGPLFPASTRAVTNWFPPSEHASGNAMSLAGISIGSLLMPPIVSWMVTQLTWQRSFYVAATFSLVLAVIWWIYVRDFPSEHRGVGMAELKRIGTQATRSQTPATRSFEPLRNGDLWRLVASYTLNGYIGYVFIFWSFLYLVQERKLGQTEGAWWTSYAWALAAVMTFAGGWISDRLTRIFVRDERGRRAVYGGTEKFQTDPHWRDHILFYEYFHGDNGAGLGASHQTGWTGTIATLMDVFGRVDANAALEVERSRLSEQVAEEQVGGGVIRKY
jgi:ACS family glucarate transporter-like MFS transporter